MIGAVVDTGGLRPVRLTKTRIAILELIKKEGAVSASDVARDLIRGRNQRTAKAQLAALHKLGLIAPIRICEYKLSDAGQAWLDLREEVRGPGRPPVGDAPLTRKVQVRLAEADHAAVATAVAAHNRRGGDQTTPSDWLRRHGVAAAREAVDDEFQRRDGELRADLELDA